MPEPWVPVNLRLNRCFFSRQQARAELEKIWEHGPMSKGDSISRTGREGRDSCLNPLERWALFEIRSSCSLQVTFQCLRRGGLVHPETASCWPQLAESPKSTEIKTFKPAFRRRRSVPWSLSGTTCLNQRSLPKATPGTSVSLLHCQEEGVRGTHGDGNLPV